MSTEKFDEILDQCLSMMQAGVSIDDCVAPYPQHAAELRAQLQTAQTLWDAKSTAQPEPTAQAKGRSRVLTAVAELREGARTAPALGLFAPLLLPFQGKPWKGLRPPARLGQALPAVVALLVLGGAAMGVSAATGDGPLGALFSPSSNESQVLGTVTDVDCTGGTITIDGVKVLITSDTEFDGLTCDDITVGMVLSVDTIDDGGSLTASEIEIEDDDLIDGEATDEDDADEPDDANEDTDDEGTDGDDDCDDADELDDADEDDGDADEEDGDADDCDDVNAPDDADEDDGDDTDADDEDDADEGDGDADEEDDGDAEEDEEEEA